MKRIRCKTSQIMPIRPGFTFLEFLVAMVVLGIALTGLFPLMVVCSRGVESLELRYSEQGNKNNNWFSPVYRTDTTGVIPRDDYGDWYAIPPDDPWARKLGAVTTFSRSQPTGTAPTTIIDDSDSGYSTTGTWTSQANTNAFLADQQLHDAGGDSSEKATWTFSNVPTGRYYVLATWQADSTLATNASYTIYDGNADTTPVTVSINQTGAPSGDVYTGWQVLTTRIFTSSDKVIKVTLSCNAGKAVVADGMRIVPTSSILSVSKSFNSEEVSIRVKLGASLPP
jgi:prepilin-type N-terminal cleavage/methylation domain-containing protein